MAKPLQLPMSHHVSDLFHRQAPARSPLTFWEAHIILYVTIFDNLFTVLLYFRLLNKSVTEISSTSIRGSTDIGFYTWTNFQNETTYLFGEFKHDYLHDKHFKIILFLMNSLRFGHTYVQI